MLAVGSPFTTPVAARDCLVVGCSGEGSFGRVWRATWRSSEVAVKEFVFRQSALPHDESQKGDIIEEIVGEAGIMSHLRYVQWSDAWDTRHIVSKKACRWRNFRYEIQVLQPHLLLCVVCPLRPRHPKILQLYGCSLTVGTSL